MAPTGVLLRDPCPLGLLEILTLVIKLKYTWAQTKLLFQHFEVYECVVLLLAAFRY